MTIIKNKVKVKLITNHIKSTGTCKTRFAKQCNVGIYTFNKILDETQVYQISSLYKIAKVMDIRFCDLFR